MKETYISQSQKGRTKVNTIKLYMLLYVNKHVLVGTLWIHSWLSGRKPIQI
jgi:hypothetical protein